MQSTTPSLAFSSIKIAVPIFYLLFLNKSCVEANELDGIAIKYSHVMCCSQFTFLLFPVLFRLSCVNKSVEYTRSGKHFTPDSTASFGKHLGMHLFNENPNLIRHRRRRRRNRKKQSRRSGINEGVSSSLSYAGWRFISVVKTLSRLCSHW